MKKKIHLLIRNDRVFFKTNHETINKIIKKKFTFIDKSLARVGNGKYKANMVRRICLVDFKKENENEGTFQIGFLKDTILLMRENNILISIDDQRYKFKFKEDDIIDNLLNEKGEEITLYDFQKNAVIDLIKNRVGILEAKVSAGKGEMAKSIIYTLNMPTLIIEPNKNLCADMYDRFATEFGENKVGICMSGSFKDLDSKIILATPGSVHRIQDIDKFKVLIIDECHAAASKTYQDLFNKVLIHIPFRFGLSGTPYTSHGNNSIEFGRIKQFLGGVVHKIDIKKLIENNVAVDGRIFVYNIKSPNDTELFKEIDKYREYGVDHSAIDGIDYNSLYNRFIVLNPESNMKIKEICEKDSSGSCFVTTIRMLHAFILEDMIDDAYCIHGEMPIKERLNILENFKNKKFKTLIATNVIKEGVNIKIIDSYINAARLKAVVPVIQKMGRGLRKYDGKLYLNIYEFNDDGSRLFNRHFKTRLGHYKKNGITEVVYV